MTIQESNPALNPARAELDAKREQRKAAAEQKKAFETWRIQQIDKGIKENLDMAEFKRQQDLGLIPATPASTDEPAPADQPPAGNDVEEVKLDGLGNEPTTEAPSADAEFAPAPEEAAPPADPTQPEQAPAADTPKAPPAGAAVPVPLPELPTAVRQFVQEKGAAVVHRAWSETMHAQKRPIKEELRLFPKLGDQDLELDRNIAAAVVQAWTDFAEPPLKRAVEALLAAAQAYDGVDAHDPNKGRFLVDAATLNKLGDILAMPAGTGKERMTVQAIQQGGFLASMNDLLTQAGKQLDAAGGGEVKVVGTITVKAERGNMLREIKSVAELKTGKLERVEFHTKAAGRDGELTLWSNSAAATSDAKAIQKAEKAKRGGKAKAGSEAAATA